MKTLATLLFPLSLLLATASVASAQVCFQTDSPAREPLAEAMRVEFASRGVEVRLSPAPVGDTAGSRASVARKAAQESGAQLAVWLDDDGAGHAAVFVATAYDASPPRYTSLPAAPEELDPRLLAVLASSVADEVLSPPVMPEPARVVLVQPVVETSPPAPPPAPAEPAPPVRAAVDFAALSAGHPRADFAFDFVPFVGTSSAFGGRDVRGLSLSLVGGLSYGIDGLSLATTFQITGGFLRGASLAGAVNIVGGPVQGAQLAGALAVAGPVQGLQYAQGLGVIGGDLEGAQLAGGLGITSGNVEGAQLAGALTIAGGSVHGVQLAGGMNLAGGAVDGLQWTGGLNVAGGAVNGAQLGTVNVAGGRVHGVQLGVVNVSEDADFSLGIVNILRRGRTHLELLGQENGTFTLTLKHGGRHFHYLYEVGARFASTTEFVAGVGLGGRIEANEDFFVDVDLVAQAYVRDFTQGGLHMVSSLRVMLGWRVVDGLSIVGGVSYNVFTGIDDDGARLPLFGDTLYTGGSLGDTTVRGWPGLLLGVQAF